MLAGVIEVLWAEFERRRATRAARAASAAASLRAGDAGAAVELLGAWTFAVEPALWAPLLEALRQVRAQPPPSVCAAWLTPRPVPAADEDRPERAWLREAPRTAAAACDPLTWALAALSFWGEEVATLERDSWAGRGVVADADADARAAGLWAAWFTGDLARVWRGWEPQYWAPARRALQHALTARCVPVDRHREIVDETRESFLALFLGSRGPDAGWRELAVRVIEGGDPRGPVLALSRALDPAIWPAFHRCAALRQPWRRTREALDPEREARGPFDPAWVAEDPSRVEALLDAHTALRLARAWRFPDACGLEQSWRVVRHHRHRVRGRLRALVRDQPGDRLRDALMALDGLHARTGRAVGTYLWTWAHAELPHRFAVEPRQLTPSCRAPQGGRTDRVDTSEILEIERAWVGLVCLRGLADRLRLFALQRSKTNGSLGELLGMLPDRVADPAPVSNRTWRGLRRSLRRRLPSYEAASRPLFEALARLDPASRRLKAEAAPLLAAALVSDIPLPRGGYPKMVRHARDLVGGDP